MKWSKIATESLGIVWELSFLVQFLLYHMKVWKNSSRIDSSHSCCHFLHSSGFYSVYVMQCGFLKSITGKITQGIQKIMQAKKLKVFFLNIFLIRRLSGLEILNNSTLIIQKWLVPRLFPNIFHYMNFRKNHTLIMNLISALDPNSNMLFLRNEFSKIVEELFTIS